MSNVADVIKQFPALAADDAEMYIYRVWGSAETDWVWYAKDLARPKRPPFRLELPKQPIPMPLAA